MRVLQVKDRPTTLARALAELGRIIKTLHMLGYIDSKEKRRRILTQLNRQEFRHRLARRVCHGDRGEIRKALPPGAGGAARRPRPDAERHRAVELDLHPGSASTSSAARVGTSAKPTSPGSRRSLFKHINFLGRYAFDLPQAIADGALRPLRNPNSE